MMLQINKTNKHKHIKLPLTFLLTVLLQRGYFIQYKIHPKSSEPAEICVTSRHARPLILPLIAWEVARRARQKSGTPE